MTGQNTVNILEKIWAFVLFFNPDSNMIFKTIYQVLEDFSSFLVKLEALHKECQTDPIAKKGSKVVRIAFQLILSL